MDRELLPNLFVLGAPKCGTTALCNYLRQHPDIYVPPKEMHFFGSDLSFLNKPRVTADVMRTTYEGSQGLRYRSDCAIWYLYSQTAAEEISQVSPDARCIALLRSPAEMVYS